MGSLTDGEKNNNNPHKMKDIQSDSTPSELPTKADNMGNLAIEASTAESEMCVNSKSVTKEKIRNIKNVLFISISFMCLFTAFAVSSVLQSSINSEGGLGVIAQSTIYVAQIISSMFIPSLIIQKFGPKWTLVVCQLCYSVYIGAQFYPSFATLVPAAVLVGLAAAPMWTAQSTYITAVAIRYSKLTNVDAEKKSIESVIARFFGLFFMINQTSTIWGNLISSTVLATGSKSNISQEQLSYCGVNYCNQDFSNFSSGDGSGDDVIDRTTLNLLFGILLGFTLLAAAIVLFLVDPLKNKDEKPTPKKSVWNLLIATFNQVRNPYQMSMIPLTMWSGFSLVFLSAEFTAAYISCSWGVEHIGYVMVCLGTVAAISSALFGFLVKKIGRLPIILFGASINFTLLMIFLYVWYPDPAHSEIFFVVSGFMGMANAIWNTQISSFYGMFFKDNKEAAFSNFRLWQSLGFAIGYAYSTFLCVEVKLYICLGVLTSGIVGYLFTEFKNRSHLQHIDSDNAIK